MNEQSQSYTAAQSNKIQDATPLQGALNDHGEQVDKLSSLIAALEERLHSVINAVPSAESDAKSELSRGGSLIVGQVAAHTSYIKSLQARVSYLLNNLEI